MKTTGHKWINEKEGIAANYRPGTMSGQGGDRIVYSTRKDRTGSTVCLICGVTLRNLGGHLLVVHEMRAAEYRQKYGAKARISDPECYLDNNGRRANAAQRRWEKHRWCICQKCGKRFSRKKKGHRPKYCGAVCRSAVSSEQNRRGEFRGCLTCGTRFWTSPSENKRYCCQKCRPAGAAQLRAFAAQCQKQHEEAVKRHTKKCACCGREFLSVRLNARVCSVECRTKFYDYRRPRPDLQTGTTTPCPHCGTPVYGTPFWRARQRRLFCSHECYAASNRGKIPEALQRVAEATRRRLSAEAQTRRGNCLACGAPLPRHHKKFCSVACYRATGVTTSRRA